MPWNKKPISLLLWLLLAAVLKAPALACDYYAAPQRRGIADGKSTATAFVIWDFWGSNRAAPGVTLCLADGVYTGTNGRIETPSGLSGLPGKPITIRALNDGQVLLDPREGAYVVWVRGDYFAIEGLNARNGLEGVYSLGGSHNRGRRLIGWDGTSGQADSNIFSVGRHVDNIFEDCAGWGANSRKIFDGAQSLAPGQKSGWSGFRRCWGEWNDHPDGVSRPSNTYQMGYRTRQQRFENVLGTWNTTGEVDDPEGIFSHFFTCVEDMSVDSELLGSIFYVPAGNAYNKRDVVFTHCTSSTTFRDVVAFLEAGNPSTKPFYFYRNPSPGPQTNNRCINCVGVHNGSPSVVQSGTGWTLENFREADTLAKATNGANVFELLPGICRRYVAGTLTNEPLWPWPMNQRIIDARIASGRTPVDVTATINTLLGGIPAQCRSGGTPADRTPPAKPKRLRFR